MSITRKLASLMYHCHINNVVLSRISNIKDLGITFDEQFLFIQHICIIGGNSYKKLGFLCMNYKDFRNINVLYFKSFTLISRGLVYLFDLLFRLCVCTASGIHFDSVRLLSSLDFITFIRFV